MATILEPTQPIDPNHSFTLSVQATVSGGYWELRVNGEAVDEETFDTGTVPMEWVFSVDLASPNSLNYVTTGGNNVTLYHRVDIPGGGSDEETINVGEFHVSQDDQPPGVAAEVTSATVNRTRVYKGEFVRVGVVMENYLSDYFVQADVIVNRVEDDGEETLFHDRVYIEPGEQLEEIPLEMSKTGQPVELCAFLTNITEHPISP